MTSRMFQLALPALLCVSLKNGVNVESFSVVRPARSTCFLQPSSSRTLSGATLSNNLPVHFSTSLSQVDEESVASAEDKPEDTTPIVAEDAPIVAEAAPMLAEETPIVAEETAIVAEGEAENEKEQKAVQRERNTLFVGNLPFEKTDDEVRALFEPYGKVELVNIPRNKATGDPRGFAFVDMASSEDLDAAIAGLDGAAFGSRNIRVSKSVPKGEGDKQAPAATFRKNDVMEGATKLYIGNIPFETTVEEITTYYQAYGEVMEAYIPMDRNSGKGRGFAFVTMKEEDAARALEETNGREYEGRKLVVSVPLPPGEKAPPRKSSRVKLYIGNLSFYTIPDTLIDAFSEFGTVHDCYLPEDPATGASRGFGFVTMDKESALQAVAELDGCEIDGRKVRVNQAQPKGETSGGKRSYRDSDPDLP